MNSQRHSHPRGRRRTSARKPYALALESLELRLAPSATYYVSPSGNDTRDGLSPQTAWRTLGRVNSQTHQAGDTYLFQGGATFNGWLNLYLTRGSPADPITFSSYGAGRATINSGANRGIWAGTTGGLAINNLNLVGSGANVNRLGGIDISNIGHASNIAIDQVDVSGYGFVGISIASDPVYGMSNIRVTNSRLHDNANGLSIGNGDSPARVISNVYIGNVEADNNNATTAPMAGIGIMLNNISGGVVERSLIHDNGSQSRPPGVAGLLVYDSSYLTVQFNEVYRNVDPSGMDGQGIGFIGVTDSVMQYNYSHDNGNGGLQLTTDWPFQGRTERNTIRYNVSENDRSGIVVFWGVYDAYIHNNTVYTSPGPRGEFGVGGLVGFWTGARVAFWDNIFITAGEGSLPTFMSDADSMRDGYMLSLLNNTYYTPGIPAPYQTYIQWGNGGYYNLVDFRNGTGMETLANIPFGSIANPRLVNAGGGGTVGDPNLLASLDAYRLQGASPVRATGMPLMELFALNPGSQDFFNGGLPPGSGFSVGAYQAPAAYDAGGPASTPETLNAEEVPAVVESLDAYALSALTVHEGHSSWSGPRFFRPVALV